MTLFRSRYWWVWSAYTMFGGVAAGLNITRAEVAAPMRALLGGLGIGLVVYGGTVARKLGVETNSRGVRLHGLFGHRDVAWQDIDRFVVVDAWPYQPLLLLTDGSRLKTYGLGASALSHGSSFRATQRLVEELNRLVHERA